MLTPAVVADVDEPQHDPSVRLARLVDLRDLYCCGPGCSGSRTERDHLDPWPNGPTNARNLKRESPRGYHANHHGWTLRADDDGSATWTSPLNRSYWRPSPHSPPPKADLWQELPLLRRRPQGRTAAEDESEPQRQQISTGVIQVVQAAAVVHATDAATGDAAAVDDAAGSEAATEDPPPPF